jgi:hypothetical protein
VDPVPDSRNLKLAKELDFAVEEVEFWQGKYEEAMKIVHKLKRHCPQDLETLFKEETDSSFTYWGCGSGPQRFLGWGITLLG